MKLPKHKLYLPALIALLIAGVAFVSGVNQANAVGDAYFPQDTNVSMTVGTMVIQDGSDADSVTTSATEITLTISSGQTFTLTSADRKLLDNNGGYGFSCWSSESRIVITSSTTKTVTITPNSTACDAGGGGGGGGGGTTTVVSTPTPTPTATPTPTVTPTPTATSTPVPAVSGKMTPASRGFINLTALKLKDGDVISVAGSSDPDVYIVNPNGYKRLFLNPAIFGFYGHLGGFSKVKTTVAPTRDTLITSGLFRNCETNDQKVYGVEVTGEDSGKLHWVNTTGGQAIADDPDFFKKVFCINTKEFSWYPKGADYTSVNQIPDYTRSK